MRVAVQVWCEIDPTLNVRVERTTGEALAEPGDQLWRVSPLGQAGVAVARALPGAEVLAFALGPGHHAALRQALAGGAERAIELADATPTVAALANWLKGQADLVIADAVAGLIAARLGWSHLAGLSDLRAEPGRLLAVRHLGRGDREAVSANLPAAVRLHAPSARSPYLARARLAAVANQPIETLALEVEQTGALAVGPLEPTRPRTRAAIAPVPVAGPASNRLQALLRGPAVVPAPATTGPAKPAAQTPDQMADELVRYLRHHDLLPEPQ